MIGSPREIPCRPRSSSAKGTTMLHKPENVARGEAATGGGSERDRWREAGEVARACHEGQRGTRSWIKELRKRDAAN